MRNRIAIIGFMLVLILALGGDRAAASGNKVFDGIRKSLMASGDEEALKALTVLERRPVFPALGKAIMKDPAVNKAFQAYLSGGKTDAQLHALRDVVNGRIRDLLAQSGDQVAIQAAATLEKSPAFNKAVEDAFKEYVATMGL